jgi:hypothetical protein
MVFLPYEALSDHIESINLGKKYLIEGIERKSPPGKAYIPWDFAHPITPSKFETSNR